MLPAIGTLSGSGRRQRERVKEPLVERDSWPHNAQHMPCLALPGQHARTDDDVTGKCPSSCWTCAGGGGGAIGDDGEFGQQQARRPQPVAGGNFFPTARGTRQEMQRSIEPGIQCTIACTVRYGAFWRLLFSSLRLCGFAALRLASLRTQMSLRFVPRAPWLSLGTTSAPLGNIRRSLSPQHRHTPRPLVCG